MPEALLVTEDFVVAEVALFGYTNQHLTVSASDFSLSFNSDKEKLPVAPFASVFRSLREPSWSSPKAQAQGPAPRRQGESAPIDWPAEFHVPAAEEHSMSEQVRNAALPEGERPLPVAGLIFFKCRGLTRRSVRSNSPTLDLGARSSSS